MTQDEIIESAKEAGFNVSEGEIIVGDYGNINTITNELAKFAELILARQEQPTPSQSVDEPFCWINPIYLNRNCIGGEFAFFQANSLCVPLYTKPPLAPINTYECNGI